jgi:hypothetical protein
VAWDAGVSPWSAQEEQPVRMGPVTVGGCRQDCRHRSHGAASLSVVPVGVGTRIGRADAAARVSLASGSRVATSGCVDVNLGCQRQLGLAVVVSRCAPCSELELPSMARWLRR